MIAIVTGWIFSAFIYFKVAFDASYYHDITIFASLIMAIVLGVTIFFVTASYAIRLLHYNSGNKLNDRVTMLRLIKVTFFPFLCSLLFQLFISRVVIFGFSKDLDKEMEIFNYRGDVSQDFLIFCFVIFIPLFIHYLMCLFPTYYSYNKTTAGF